MSHHAGVAISSAIVFVGACILAAVGALNANALGAALFPFGGIVGVVALICWIDTVTSLQPAASRDEYGIAATRRSPRKEADVR